MISKKQQKHNVKPIIATEKGVVGLFGLVKFFESVSCSAIRLYPHGCHIVELEWIKVH